MSRHDSRIPRQVDSRFVRPCRHSEPAADVDLGDRVAGGAHPPDRLGRDRDRQGPLEGIQSIGEPAGPGMEVDRVDGQRMLSGYGERLVEPLETDAEFRRPVTRVLKVGVVAGARARIDGSRSPCRARRPYGRSG